MNIKVRVAATNPPINLKTTSPVDKLVEDLIEKTGGSSILLNNIIDVDADTPRDKQVLTYEAATSKYVIKDPDSSKYYYVPANSALSALRVVKLGSNNKAVYASPIDTDLQLVLGITTSAVNTDEIVTIINSGILSDNNWSWSPGQAIFLTNNGQLSTLMPSLGYILQIGTAINTTTILVKLGQIIKVV